MRPSKKHTLRLLGFVLLGTGLGLAWLNSEEANTAQTTSSVIRQQLEEHMVEKALGSEDGEMPVEAIDGVDYIGILSLPSIEIQLPVAARYDFEQMRSTPTRYAGSYYRDDLVICAHDYAGHFASLQSIPLGEEIVLTTVIGQIYRYRITNRQIIEPTAVDQVFKDTASDTDWELSLFTCTPSGLARVLIRCSRVL